MITLRPTTATDIEMVYGQPLPVTLTGLTALEGDQVLGVGAIYPLNGYMVLICKITPQGRALLHFRPAKRALLEGARYLMGQAAKSTLPLRVVADPRYPRAADLIQHLGFRHVEKDIYQCPKP